VTTRRDQERFVDRLSFVISGGSGARGCVGNSLSISRGTRAVSTGVPSRVAERGRPGSHRIRGAAARPAPARRPMVQSPQFRGLGAARVDRHPGSSVGFHLARGRMGRLVDSSAGAEAAATVRLRSHEAASVQNARSGYAQHAERGRHHIHGAARAVA